VQKAGRLEQLVQGITAVENAFSAVKSGALALGQAIVPVGSAIVAALSFAAKQAIQTAEAINKISAEAMNLGLTVEQFDQLRLGLERAGLSSQAISSGIARLKGELIERAIGCLRRKRLCDEIPHLENVGIVRRSGRFEPPIGAL
jgi:phage-related minor tail protein